MTPHEKLIRARSSLIMGHPFWGALTLLLNPQEDGKRANLATDGTSLFYNPQTVDALPDKHLEALIAQQASYCAYAHPARRGSREAAVWKKSCAYAVNRDLARAGFQLPEGHLADPRFDNMSAEEIFVVLEREKPQNQQGLGPQGQGQPMPGNQGQSPGAGNAHGQGSKPGHNPGMGSPDGEVLDAADPSNGPGLSKSEQDWKIHVAQAMAAAKGANAGEVPENMKRMFDWLKRANVDWRTILRRFIDAQCRHDYAWTKPNRRYLGRGFIIPGMIPDGVNHIVIVIDSSGSNEKSLGKFKAEAQEALDEGTTQKITIISCDTTVKAIREYEHGDSLAEYHPVGGGGTMFSPAFEWISKNCPDIAAVIYFTDLECSDFGEEPWYPVLWLAYGSANRVRKLEKAVPFGEVTLLVD